MHNREEMLLSQCIDVTQFNKPVSLGSKLKNYLAHQSVLARAATNCIQIRKPVAQSSIS